MIDAIVQISQGATIRRENLFFRKNVIVLYSPGQEIKAIVSKSQAKVEFLKHRWSGRVLIQMDSFSKEIDLYSEKPEPVTCLLEVPDDHSTLIIRVLERSQPSDQNDTITTRGNEVWVCNIFTNPPKNIFEPVVTILNDNLNLVKGQWGDFIVMEKDKAISRAIMHTGVWAEKDIPTFTQLIKPGMVICDIGANIGHHSVVFSKLATQNGRVYSFEPQDHIYKLLNANLVMNNCMNTIAFKLAMGKEKSKLKLWPVDYTKEDNFGALGISQVGGKTITDHEGEEVDIVSGDEFIEMLLKDKKPVDFIKIDVQTFELYVLQGLKNILTTMKPALFLEISPYWMKHTGYDYSEIYNLLYNAGYKIFLPHESLETPIKGITAWSGERDEEWDIVALPV